MARKDVYEAVSAVVPCRHMAWPKGGAPDLPWAVYLEDMAQTFSADNDNYAAVHQWMVELYEKAGDTELEERLHRALRARFGTTSRYETWVESEGCLMTVFRFTEIERIADV